MARPSWASLTPSRLALAQQTHDMTQRTALAESVEIERETGDRIGLAANLEVYALLAGPG